MSDYFDKDPQNPRDGGDGEGGKWPEVIGDGTGWGIKHLADPHNPRNGGDHDSKDGSSWFGGEGGYISGNDHYDAAVEYSGRTSEDINDPWLIDGGGWVIDGGTGVSEHTNSFSGDWGT